MENHISEIDEETERENGLYPNLKFLRPSDFRVVPKKYQNPHLPDNRSPEEKQEIIKKLAKRAEEGLPLFEEP